MKGEKKNTLVGTSGNFGGGGRKSTILPRSGERRGAHLEEMDGGVLKRQTFKDWGDLLTGSAPTRREIHQTKFRAVHRAPIVISAGYVNGSSLLRDSSPAAAVSRRRRSALVEGVGNARVPRENKSQLGEGCHGVVDSPERVERVRAAERGFGVLGVRRERRLRVSQGGRVVAECRGTRRSITQEQTRARHASLRSRGIFFPISSSSPHRISRRRRRRRRFRESG